MKKIEAKANIMEMANKEGRKIAISELPSIYKKDGQNVICEDGAIRSDDACFYPEGKKADGTARGCTSTVKVNFVEKINNVFSSYVEKMQLTDIEKRDAESAFEAAFDNLQTVQSVFDAANERAAAAAAEAAKAKRAAAAKEKAQRKMNNKLKESSDNEKIAALAAVLDITFDEAKIIFEKKRAQKTA